MMNTQTIRDMTSADAMAKINAIVSEMNTNRQQSNEILLFIESKMATPAFNTTIRNLLLENEFAVTVLETKRNTEIRGFRG